MMVLGYTAVFVCGVVVGFTTINFLILSAFKGIWR